MAELDDADYTEMGCKLPSGAFATNFAVGSNETVTVTFTNYQIAGTINVTKNVLAADGTTDVVDNYTFKSKLNGGNEKSFSENVTATYSVNPGSHSITETSDSNYIYIGCTPDTNGGQAGAQVSVASNQTVNVTCVNKQKPASIKIIKDARPNALTNFEFTRSFGGGFTLDDDHDVQGKDNTYDNDREFTGLNGGTYTVTEGPETGWYLGEINCTGATTTPNVGGRTVSITVNPGQNAVCTFVNFKKGEIRGEKFDDRNGNNFDDSGEPDLSGWKIFIDQNANGTYENGEPYDMTDSNGDYSFDDLMPGT